MKIVFKSILIWFGFLVLAFINGAFRELVMINVWGLGPHQAHLISCITGITLWTLLLLLVWKKLEIQKFNQALWIGMGWLMATIVFETVILNRQLTWSEILHTYDVTAGEYWGLVVLWIGFMPLAAYRIEKLFHPSKFL